MKRLLLLSFVAPLAACSEKAVYDNLQHNNRLQCDKAPLSEYDACMERASKSYEDYARERRDANES
tara:strand:- start:749 stop:946 length:198 start_codon:yes stop_codon:yes gene_type:complete